MISKIQAIQSLVPGAEVSVAAHDGSVTWINYENPPITDEQIAAEQRRLQMMHDWHEYRRNRAVEYPTIQEQLDALYHAGVFPPEMTARIRAVKEKYPAPTMTPEQLAEFNKQQQPTAEPEKLSVDQWFEEQKNVGVQLDFEREQQHWIAQQQVSNTPMTREEWLASQLKITLPGTETVVAAPQKMTREELINRLKILTKQVYSNRVITPEEAIQYDELTKFPELKAVIVDLLTPEYDSFLASIDWVAPRPSTFRINLKNGQNFYLIYGKRSWIAQVEGKKYYLLNLPEEERAAQSIANILRYGIKEEAGETGAGIESLETPPAEPTPETPPAETPEETPA
jgi:hypothetical protein